MTHERSLSAWAGRASALLMCCALPGCPTPPSGNEPPIASDRSLSVLYETPTSIVLAATDPDDGPGMLLFQIVSTPEHGTISGTPPNLTYTPDAGFSGDDSFTFTAHDGAAYSNVATVSITVYPPGVGNERPIATNQTVSIPFDTPTAIDLDVADPDDGPNPLAITIVQDPEHGAISGTGTNPIYTPGAGYTGPDGFSYYASDGADDSNTATVSITVLPPEAMAAPTLVGPVDGASVEMAPVFDWDPVPGAVNYQIDLSANELFSPVLWSTTSVPTAVGYTPGLEDGAYYWRVRGININDEEGPYSSIGTFDKSWSAVPAPLQPADGADIDTGPVFEWDPAPEADHYQVIISTSDGFGDVFASLDSHVPRIAWTPDPPDGTYYWHVRAVDVAGNNGAWSSTQNFTVAWTASPALVSPIGGASSLQTPVFEWTSVPGAAQYEIQLSANSGFSTTDWSTTMRTRRVAYTPALADGTTYFWRVRCVDADGKSGPWSSTASFVAGGLPGGEPAPPAPTAPADGAAVSEMPVLSWSAVTGAAYYHVDVSNDELFSSIADVRYTANTAYVPDDSEGGSRWDVTDAPRDLSNLSSGTYYWRVRAFDSDDNPIGDWSALRSFEVQPGAGAALVGPLDGASVSGMPTLQWSPVAGAGFYSLEISLDTAFGSISDVRYTANTAYVPDDSEGGSRWGVVAWPRDSNNLSPGTYYWRVRAYTGDAVELWQISEVRSFEVQPGVGAALTEPSDGARLSEMPTLQWSAVPGAGYYSVEISGDNTFAGTTDVRHTANTAYVPDDSEGGSRWDVTDGPRNLTNLPPGTYYWRVRAFTGDDVELWESSEIRNFVVE